LALHCAAKAYCVELPVEQEYVVSELSVSCAGSIVDQVGAQLVPVGHPVKSWPWAGPILPVALEEEQRTRHAPPPVHAALHADAVKYVTGGLLVSVEQPYMQDPALGNVMRAPSSWFAPVTST
jgi:hypothetical protein